LLDRKYKQPSYGQETSVTGELGSDQPSFFIAFDVLVTGCNLPILSGKVGFIPDGVGIVEATMTAIYASLSISSEIVVVVILGYRLLSH
jgi:uncharacterized membrane protein YbhN (UPF0104 family)